jgi:vanillate O-demethylase ferredoxin subunit
MDNATPLREMKIAGIRDVASGIREFELEPVDGKPLDNFSAGAHIECGVTLPDGKPGLRAYSLVNRPGEIDSYRIAVARSADSRGGSAYMHSLAPGDTLYVGRARNDFPLLLSAHTSLLVAGGIGVTPILAMARTLAHTGRPFQMHYVGRDRELMAYADEIEQLHGARVVVDGGDPSKGIDLANLLKDPPPACHLYVCGPRPLIEATLAEARTAGWTDRQLHFEMFGGEAPLSGDRPFTVEFALSGKVAEVAVGKTILDVMEELHLEPIFDCRRGECGVCVVDVLAGEPDHRDMNLSEREKNTGKLICTCVSRAKGDRIVLNA